MATSVEKSAQERAKRLQRQFNITPEEYDAVLAHQGGVCAICKQPPKDGGSRLAVDHCHKTGLTRGLLCTWCNRAIALFRDDVVRFEATVVYLKSPPVTAALGAPRYGMLGRVTASKKTRIRLFVKSTLEGVARLLDVELNGTPSAEEVQRDLASMDVPSRK